MTPNTPTHEEFCKAILTLFRFKNQESSGVTHADAESARTTLRRWYAGSVLRQRDITMDSPSWSTFVAEFTNGRVRPDEVPIFEWPECWENESGRAMALTCHSYPLGGDELARIAEFGKKAGVRVRISGLGSWKNAGHALLIEYRREGDDG